MKIRQAHPADAAAIARVHVDCWRTTYAGIIAEDILANLSYKDREATWKAILDDPQQVIYVAEHEDEDKQVFGFASGGPERAGDPVYKGELYAIYLLAEYQKQGIGKRLTQAIAQRLDEMELNAMLVWVLAKNPSRRFYEALGAKELYQKEILIGDRPLVEVAYGWNPLNRLLSET
jgi:GNAT superfamily N-acetyltransferase